MAGSAGIGKSTLAERIGIRLRRQHIPTDVFGEEELFTRPQFVRLAEGFRTKHYPSAQEFEAAYRSWLSTLTLDTVTIMDWNPAGMAGDLPWATGDRTRLRRHLSAVRTLAGGKVLLLHLHAPVELAIERAGRERGEEWLWHADQIAREAGHRHPKRIDRLVAEATRHAARTSDEVRIAAEAGWRIQEIDAAGEAEDVLDDATTMIVGASAAQQ
jgi:hypothetical protein